jgi:hypothetical protein
MTIGTVGAFVGLVICGRAHLLRHCFLHNFLIFLPVFTSFCRHCLDWIFLHRIAIGFLRPLDFRKTLREALLSQALVGQRLSITADIKRGMRNLKVDFMVLGLSKGDENTGSVYPVLSASVISSLSYVIEPIYTRAESVANIVIGRALTFLMYQH